VTLLTMAGVSIEMMLGISVLSTWTQFHIADDASSLTGVPAGSVRLGSTRSLFSVAIYR